MASRPSPASWSPTRKAWCGPVSSGSRPPPTCGPRWPKPASPAQAPSPTWATDLAVVSVEGLGGGGLAGHRLVLRHVGVGDGRLGVGRRDRPSVGNVDQPADLLTVDR